MPTFSSLAVLATRFNVPLTAVSKYAQRHDWADLRAKARTGIVDATHAAMVRQATENYLPLRTSAVALVGQAFTEAQAALKGSDVTKAETTTRVMDTVDRGLKNLDRALGIASPPAIALQQNNLFVQQTRPGEEPPPPSQSQTLIDPSLSGSIWSLILRARESANASSDGFIRSLEEESTLPPHLSSVPRG